MISYKRIILFCVLTSLFLSCRKDKPEEIPQPLPSTGVNGVYIINEGNFQFGNAQISYYDPARSTSIQDLFQPANNRPLGDVCQSMYLFNGKAYIVVNNSGKIEVADEKTLVSSATISGFTSPRYFLPVSNSKAYVTDFHSNTISIVDLVSNTITGTIPCKGWTEELVLAYGKAFVTNELSDKVYVINTVTDQITDSITVGYASNSIAEDKNGKLWVLCGGSRSNAIRASLHRINPVTNTVEHSVQFPDINDSPWRLNMNATNDTLYFLNKGVFRMPVGNNSLPVTPFISQNGNNFYGLGIDTESGIIYVADAIDYTQRGVVYCYSANGVLINTFLVGIVPGNFCFK